MTRPAAERGFLLVACLTLVMPLLIVTGTALLLMHSRSDAVQAGIEQNRALMAAEAGLDDAIFRSNTGTLLDAVSFQGSLDNGLGYDVRPLEVESNGVDLDGDGFSDDATESLYRVESTGRYGDAVKTLVAYIRYQAVPFGIDSSLQVQNPKAAITIKGTPGVLSGYNHNPDGTLGDPAKSVFGMTVVPPATVADALSVLDARDATQVEGRGGAPSIKESSGTVDIDGLIARFRASSDLNLATNEYANLKFGSAATHDYRTVIRDGNLTLKGDSHGAGVLVVTGDLLMQGTASFEGIIVVLGHIEFGGDNTIVGSMVAGPGSEHITLEGTSTVLYSAETVQGAGSLIPEMRTTVTGWDDRGRSLDAMHLTATPQ